MATYPVSLKGDGDGHLSNLFERDGYPSQPFRRGCIMQPTIIQQHVCQIVDDTSVMTRVYQKTVGGHLPLHKGWGGHLSFSRGVGLGGHLSLKGWGAFLPLKKDRDGHFSLLKGFGVVFLVRADHPQKM